MNQLEAMQIYMRVAELASFTEAADNMGLAKASVSSAVQKLEAQLATRLLHRTTRRVQMTQDGQAFYERCRDVLADMEELQTMFHAGKSQLSGRLRVDMPIAVARDLVIPRLHEFMDAHPNLEIELSSTDRRVDLVREGFDCVIRVGTLSDSSLIARHLGDYKLINCASPAYIEKFGTPTTLEDLASHRLIHYVGVLGAKSAGFEYIDKSTGKQKFIAMQGAISVNNSDAYMSACLGGLGIIQVPLSLASKHKLREGGVVEVLSEFLAPPMPVSIVYPNRRHLPKRVQVFMAWVADILEFENA